MANVSSMTTTANRVAELRERVAAKTAYGVKCTRDANELARLEDAMRSPFHRLVRKCSLYILIAVGCVLAYLPIAFPFVKLYVGG